MIVEIRAAEGGDDAKALVREQLGVYEARAKRQGVKLSLVEDSPAMISFRAAGRMAPEMFRDEAGGHRWQRVPPNERRGRVHTSTVTVAVLPEADAGDVTVDRRDVDESVTRGSGPGGQHRNKTETCVMLRHRPTGIAVRCDAERSQGANRDLAWATLRARVAGRNRDLLEAARASDRRGQVGSGMRGDKRRTIRTQDGVVTDHPTGRRWNLRAYLRGEW